MSEKVRENRLRRMADRQGLRLEKSRRRDPHANDYGLYNLFAHDTGGAVWPSAPWGPFVATLDEVEEYLTSD